MGHKEKFMGHYVMRYWVGTSKTTAAILHTV